ncbi:MAG TPA: phytoene/squalene synthase family protein [Terracidiphilus sp.]|jgi:phytoene synthase|nr:phytoene/squalene synthase family protein [Terracidiphilus sp.]
MSQGSTEAITLDAAYATCRMIARREAKNFYYAFVALPEPRRNAICAVYAFMRKADDLSDDESLSREDRRRNLEQWQSAWHRAAAGSPTDDPVFIAVRDAIQRYAIPLSLLDELIAGTTSDLKANPTDAPDTYATFGDLYRYCYLVASVVGLVCIRIFGYTDSAAEKLAEETGVAFQLTNILRDVAEDAERGRVYLPLQDLSTHNVTLDSMLHRAAAKSPTPNERALLADIGRRAEGYYASADRLLPLIHHESRPALWVLVSIYHALLRRIERADYDVFSKRASVPTAQKVGILVAGMTRLAIARITG